MKNRVKCWILLLFILGLIIKTMKPTIKGWIGEKYVALILSKLSVEQYIVLNNVMLPSVNGTTQIDHIVVSLYGIFVIETKNYKGWITGEENSEYWIKNMYGRKYNFKNPMHQNYGHIKTLEAFLNISPECFISIVAFSQDATLKVKTQKNVIYIKDLHKTIMNYKFSRMEYFEIKKYSEQMQGIR